MNLDWSLVESIAKTIGTLIGIGAAGYQAYRLGVRGFRSRITLKRDLEILTMLEPTDPNHAVIRSHISRVVHKLYSPPPVKVPRTRAWLLTGLPPQEKRRDFAINLLGFTAFSIWTAYLNRNGFAWWSVLTGFAALSGIVGMLDAYGFVRDPSSQSQQPGIPISVAHPGSEGSDT